ncbi:glycoside hydrolase family 16 protein [Spirochaetia bacterium 38H-sp]|uniref:Glycoside hydrolase family 16 protein n=1 Tax=Rarispira pelagica TaxID=3141764 RepID=A0ABU9U8J0_9SPIR
MNKVKISAFPIIILLGLIISVSCESVPGEKDNKKLVLSEEFSDKALNPSLWQYSISNPDWRKGIHTIYTSAEENIYIKDGKLNISAIKNPDTRQWTSARIRTKPELGWKYGRIEVSAQIPAQQGTRAYISLLPTEKTELWPACGEIILLSGTYKENRTIAEAGIENKIYNSLLGTEKKAGYDITQNKTKDGFHIFAVDWSPNEIKFYADDKLILSYKKEEDSSALWPYDKKYGIAIELMITNPEIEPQENPTLSIDYIRIYQASQNQ